MCAQHHRPLSQCDPWNRHQHSNRFREDDWQATEHTAKATGIPTTELIALGMQVMQDYIRCDKGGCSLDGPPVPVTFGDMTGKTFGEWVAKAAEEVTAQHPDHKPVTIGAQPHTPAGEGNEAAVKAGPATARTEPPASARKAPRGRKVSAAPAVFADGTGRKAAW